MGEYSAMVMLIKRSIAFADWAAGEGICPATWEDADRAERNPDEFLAAYSEATGDEDWGTIADRITTAYEDMGVRLCGKNAQIGMLRSVLIEAQTVMAMMVEPDAITGSTVMSAYANCKAMDTRIRNALEGVDPDA